MEEQEMSNFVILPRRIASDYRDGILTIAERNLYLWIRILGNPYGIAHVDMDNLAKESFNSSVDKSYINKLLLSLKSKRYVWYKERKGRRGSFELHMGDWILPSKHIKTLDHYFSQKSVLPLIRSEPEVHDDVSPHFDSCSQRLDIEKSVVSKEESRKAIRQILRGCDTDKDNNKEKDNKSLQKSVEDCLVDKFVPRGNVEERCLEIAKEIGDESVGYCLGINKKHGLDLLERALDIFYTHSGGQKQKPSSYFNHLVRQIIADEEGKN
jgi:hypothetical protein